MQVLNVTDKQIPLSVGTIVASVNNIDGAEIIAMDGQTSNERSQYKHIELDLSSSVLNDQEKQLFQEFINKNSDIFANDLSEFGKCNIFKHTIKTIHE